MNLKRKLTHASIRLRGKPRVLRETTKMVCRPCPSTLDKSLQGGQPVTVKRFAADMSPALCDMQRRTLDNLHQRPSVAGLQVSPSGKTIGSFFWGYQFFLGIEHQGDGDSHGPPLFDQVGAFGPTSTWALRSRASGGCPSAQPMGVVTEIISWPYDNSGFQVGASTEVNKIISYNFIFQYPTFHGWNLECVQLQWLWILGEKNTSLSHATEHPAHSFTHVCSPKTPRGPRKLTKPWLHPHVIIENTFTLWLWLMTNIAMVCRWPIEIDGLPFLIAWVDLSMANCNK